LARKRPGNGVRLAGKEPIPSLSDENDLELVVLHAPIGICILNAKTLVSELVNDKFLEVAGKPYEAIFGKHYWEPFAEARPYYEEALNNVIVTGEPFYANEIELMLIRHGKEENIVVTFVYSPVKNNAGHVTKVAVWVLENTQQVKARQEIFGLNERLASANREMQDAIQSLSVANHDLLQSNRNIGALNVRLQESQTNFKRLVEQAPVAIMVFRGPELVIDLANAPILEILHRDSSVIGKPILESMPELKGEPAVQLIFEVFRTGKGSDGNETPVQMMRDGLTETRYFNFSYRPLLDGGRVVGVMDLAVEVTDQVQSRKRLESIIEEKTALEQSLRGSQQRLQGILNTMAEGVGVIDTSGKLVYANEMAQRILGLTHSEIQDRTFDDPRWQNLRVDGSLLPDGEHPMAIMMRTGLPVYDQEIAVQPVGGERFYISINAAPILDDAGKLTGGIGTFMDVTNRRKLMMQKDDFISVASHELKTPVTALKASLQLLERLQEQGDDTMRVQLIAQANKSLNKLSGLIGDLLNTNRITQGQLHLRPTNFKVADLINDSCQHIGIAGTHSITVSGEVEAEAFGDQLQLEQVLVNLVNNAVKYAPDSRDISIFVSREGDKIKISVTDHGAGIAVEKLPHVFDRYYRADHSGAQFSGLGLGLFISAEIVKKHGGELSVESEPGKGSTFWFTVPAGRSREG
jgi:PAS domain S-box-containing protein